MARKQRRYASFLVRIWQEPREKEGQPPQWRGSIEHVQGEEKFYFKDQQAMVELIQEIINEWLSEAGQGKEPT